MLSPLFPSRPLHRSSNQFNYSSSSRLPSRKRRRKKRNRKGLYAYHFLCHVCMYISVSVNRWSFFLSKHIQQKIIHVTNLESDSPAFVLASNSCKFGQFDSINTVAICISSNIHGCLYVVVIELRCPAIASVCLGTGIRPEKKN